MGLGLIRKALFIMTGGLSGRVFKDNSKKGRATKPSEKSVRLENQAGATRPKAQKARRKPQKARTSRGAQAGGSDNGPTRELERLTKLYDQRALTDEEFAAAKAKILGTSPTPPAPTGVRATYPAVEANVAAARHLADVADRDRDAPIATVIGD